MDKRAALYQQAPDTDIVKTNEASDAQSQFDTHQAAAALCDRDILFPAELAAMHVPGGLFCTDAVCDGARG